MSESVTSCKKKQRGIRYISIYFKIPGVVRVKLNCKTPNPSNGKERYLEYQTQYQLTSEIIGLTAVLYLTAQLNIPLHVLPTKLLQH